MAFPKIKIPGASGAENDEPAEQEDEQLVALFANRNELKRNLDQVRDELESKTLELEKIQSQSGEREERLIGLEKIRTSWKTKMNPSRSNSGEGPSCPRYSSGPYGGIEYGVRARRKG